MNFFKKELPLFQAVSTMVGAIIGAGILGIPYVFAKAGFWTGTIVLVFVAFAMIAMKMMFGEVTLRTYGRHQLPGYVEKYLGKSWRNISSVIMVVTVSGALVAYFIGIGEVLGTIFGGSMLFWSFLFYIIGALFLYKGIKVIKEAEFILTLFIFLIVAVIAVLSFDHISLNNLATFDMSKLLIPYGVVLFACSGMMAIPEVRQILFRREHLFKKAVFLGAFIPAIIYFIFAWIVVGVTGGSTTEVATIGLGNVMGNKIVIVGNLFAFFTISTSFLTTGLGLKETFNFDFKVKHIWAWLITITVPLIIYFLGMRDFIQIIGLVGALGFGVNGVIYIFTYWAARKKSERHPEYVLSRKFTFPVSILLICIFVGGLIYMVVDNFL